MRNGYHIGFVLAIIGAAIAITTATAPHHWGVWSAMAVFCLLFGLLNYGADDETDAARILNRISERDTLGLYSYLVGKIQTLLERIMSPDTAENRPPPTKGLMQKFAWWTNPRARDADDLRALQADTFSWPVMDTALKLAIIYPFLLLLGQWWWLGTETGIGSVTILSALDSMWWRSALFCPLALALVFKFVASASQKPHLKNGFEWLMQIAVVAAVAVAVASTFVVPFIVAFAGAVAVAVGGAFAVAVLVALAVTLAVAVPGAVAVAGAFAVAGVMLVSRSCQSGHGRTGYLRFFCALVLAGLAASSLAPVVNDNTSGLKLIVFALSVLPLVNAAFDYLSYGLTLLLIKKGRLWMEGWPLLLGLADLVIAVVLLFAVSFTLLCAVALINALSAAPFLDISQVLQDLKDPNARGAYTWLYLTLFSTLVPTLIHAIIGVLGALSIVSKSHKRQIAHLIGPDSGGHLTTLLGTGWAALIGTFYAAFVTLCLLALIWALAQSGTLALYLIDAVEWAATTLNLI